MPAKVCPRCGAQYANLKSTTCPECFAVLVPVDDATAEELAAARAEVERSQEFQAVKAADDERFKEQSFGACLAVVAITVLTLIVGIVLIVTAAHHKAAPSSPIPAHKFATLPSEGRDRPGTNVNGPGIGNDGPGIGNDGPEEPSQPLTTLPVAAATLDEVLPPTLGPYQRLNRDQTTVLTGTLTPLFHAVYALPGGKPMDVYALPAGRPTDEQNEYRLGLTVASHVGGSPHPLLFFATEYWHFAVLAAPSEANGPTEFRNALTGHFRE